MAAEEKIEEIKEAMHAYNRGEFSIHALAIIIGTIVEPIKPSEADLEWGKQKAIELGLMKQ